MEKRPRFENACILMMLKRDWERRMEAVGINGERAFYCAFELVYKAHCLCRMIVCHGWEMKFSLCFLIYATKWSYNWV